MDPQDQWAPRDYPDTLDLLVAEFFVFFHKLMQALRMYLRKAHFATEFFLQVPKGCLVPQGQLGHPVKKVRPGWLDCPVLVAQRVGALTYV